MARKPSNPSIPRKLSPQQSIPLLKRQLERLQNEIIKLSKNNPDVAAWERSTINLLTNAFGQPSGNPHANTFDFEHANSGEPILALAFDEYYEEARHQQLKQQKRAALLKSYIEQLEDEVAVSAMSPHEASSAEVIQKPVGSKVFIGHGHSLIWRELKDFLQDRLGLLWDEFNSESAAGLSTKERLKTMLDNSVFAFLVLTAEEEYPDGTLHSRENVIHEAGLFQGRLGFERAIILKERGCAEFSNIHGLTQIWFPKGNISAAFEEIRQVLEREGMIGNKNR